MYWLELLELSYEFTEHLRAGGTLVVPSAQRAAALRLAYGAAQITAGARVWNTPDVLPWSAWLARGLDEARARGGAIPRRLAGAEEWWLWRGAVRSACSDDLGVLWPDGLVDTVRRSVQLLEDFGLTVRDSATPESAVLLRAQSRFARDCEQLQALSGSSWRACSDHIELSVPTRLIGFTEIGPARRAWLERLGVQLQATPGHRESASRVEIRTLEDPEREALVAAEWCAQRLQDNPGARLLLVLPALGEQRHRWLRALTQRLEPLSSASGDSAIAIEGGQPLAEFALVQLALQLLALAIGDADFTTLSAVLRSPYLPAASREARLRIDVWLREHNIDITAARLRGLIDPVARALGSPAADTLRGLIALQLPAQAATADWAQRFAQSLQQAGWPGAPLSSAEQQVRMRFDELLGEFASIARAPALLTPDAALATLQQLCDATAFEPASNDVPVTVTRSLSDPIARYDGIWVAGLTADAWPQRLRPDPLIPWHLQQSFQMPAVDATEPLRRAEHSLGCWRAATDRLVLSYARSEADLPLDPSPLLLEIMQRQGSGASVAAAEPFELEAWLAARAPRLEALEDAAGSPWPPGQTLRGGAQLLELQALCPFRAFAYLRLQARPLPEPVPGIDPSVRGRILHRALELFWSEIGDAATLRKRRSELAALARACIERALLEAQQREPGGIDARLWPREASRDARLFDLLLDWELTREPFAVEAVERAQEFTIGGAALRLRLDRVDRLPDGRAIVFDYKTGADQPFDALADRLRQPQLPAYAIATGERTAAVAALYLTRQRLKLRGIADSPGRLGELRPLRDGEPDWPSLLQRWRAQLTELVQEFLHGHAAVAPLAKACDYCHLRTLCRIRPAPLTEPEDPSPEPESPWIPPS